MKAERLTKAALSRRFGVSRAAIGQSLNAPFAPKPDSHGLYSVRHVEMWREYREQLDAASPSHSSRPKRELFRIYIERTLIQRQFEGEPLTGKQLRQMIRDAMREYDEHANKEGNERNDRGRTAMETTPKLLDGGAQGTAAA